MKRMSGLSLLPPPCILNVRARAGFAGSASDSRDVRGRDGRLSQQASLEPSGLSFMDHRRSPEWWKRAVWSAWANNSHKLMGLVVPIQAPTAVTPLPPVPPRTRGCVPEPPVYHDGLPPSSIMPFKHDCCTNSSGQDSCSASFHAENAPTAERWRAKARRTAKSMPSRLASLVAGTFDRTG